MATDKQLSLSEFIKNVHQQLRDDSKIMGSLKAWNKHCDNEVQLKLYADAMKELAMNHWDHNMSVTTKEVSRILWVYDICLEYFWHDKIQYYRNKEKDIVQKINIVSVNTEQTAHCLDSPIKMLDVGSCYNPFGIYPEYFEVLPIDIAPATSDVYKCDFLKVDISTCTEKKVNEIYKLEQNSFHVIVFSLLLEYLPTPEFRLLCCEKAYKLLKHEGLLLIITPDSKHVGANAKLMKSWQYILANLGFTRIRYIKLQHIHCMAFRKNIFPETAQRWAALHQNEDLYDEIYIPQDFNTVSTNTSPSVEKNDSYVLDYLPNFVDINELL